MDYLLGKRNYSLSMLEIENKFAIFLIWKINKSSLWILILRSIKETSTVNTDEFQYSEI